MVQTHSHHVFVIEFKSQLDLEFAFIKTEVLVNHNKAYCYRFFFNFLSMREHLVLGHSIIQKPVKCDFTKFNSFRANFLDSVSVNARPFFILRLSILRPKSLWKLKGNMFPVRMLLIRKDSIKNKYQNVSPTSVTSQKSSSKSYTSLLSIGFPTVRI